MSERSQKQASCSQEPIDQQFIVKAQDWLSKHVKLAKALCAPPETIPDELFQDELQKAFKQGDYAYYALLTFQKEIELHK